MSMKPARVVLDHVAIQRALTRIAHEILEKNRDTDHLALVGIHTRGVYLSQRLAAEIKREEGVALPCGVIDITLYRDDVGRSRMQPEVRNTDIPFVVAGSRIVLVDDVLYTGRTARAALDALIDRGHRELPIRPDYVGKNLPTARDEHVYVRLIEHDGVDEVVIE